MCLLYYFDRLLNDMYCGNVKLMDFPAIRLSWTPNIKTSQEKSVNDETKVCYHIQCKKVPDLDSQV